MPKIEIQDGLVKKLSQQEANSLKGMPSDEEIKAAIWSCDLTKSPGYDGFNLNFIRKMWSVIGNEFMSLVVDFFQSGNLQRKLNMHRLR